MKVRMQDDKLIYRLQTEDLAFLKANNYCEHTLFIGNASLKFRLESHQILQEEITFHENNINIKIHEEKLLQWVLTDTIEIVFFAENTKIIIEKDLKEFRRHAS